jgi:hypothetical protein
VLAVDAQVRRCTRHRAPHAKDASLPPDRSPTGATPGRASAAIGELIEDARHPADRDRVEARPATSPGHTPNRERSQVYRQNAEGDALDRECRVEDQVVEACSPAQAFPSSRRHSRKS